MTDNAVKFVTVIIPCRNEEKFISKVLENVLNQNYPSGNIEVFVVDGESEDNTAEIVREYSAKYPFIRLLNNPHQFVPQALNMAIRESKGEVIIRMDAHSLYPNDYFSKLVTALFQSGADNAGGMWITEPGDESKEAAAIALATSHPFGIGNARYRLGASEQIFVDTVPYGCYRREVFDRIGYFDEQLLRNQDDEFNGRLIANGGRILLLPDVKIRYFARKNIALMAKMFYQYGLFKPLVNIKLGKPATIRQLFPPALVLGLIGSFVIGLFITLIFQLFIVVFALYSAMVLYFSIVVGKNSQLIIQLIKIFPSIHFSYGWGYLKGIWRFMIWRKHKSGNSADLKFNK